MADLPLVLLVDDDEAARYLHQRLLRPYLANIELAVAENGQEALHQLLARPDDATPALVLLDLNMPFMGGLAFLEVYSHWPPAQQQRTAVVVLSSSVMATERQRTQELGAGFEAKPLTAPVVGRLLLQHLGVALPTG
ncbi:response regulator [Hymenobacter ginsengisoli]|uniref:Response regulator n=1 Tax=Hymenobacter ginsengisoli TaxID=1051626 RepID=A0ABP8QCF2_9BACT|nr:MULTISPECIES: response regulator [unclassified Hymenobacter]MBO2030707.1 response regulator [Hymenobacter sp. BT559]